MSGLDRRGFIGAAAGSLAFATSALGRPLDSETLGGIAASRGLHFGSAIRPHLLDVDPDYAALLLQDCVIFVTEGSMTWPINWPEPNVRAYELADRGMAFASDNGIMMRGHWLVSGHLVPRWMQDLRMSPAAARYRLRSRIAQITQRYRGQIQSWDVLNEVVDFRRNKGTAQGLRRNIWLDTLGEQYLTLTMRAAKRADPNAVMVLNERHFSVDEPDSRWHRRKLLELIRSFQRDGIGPHALGIHSHIMAGEPLDLDEFRRFLDDVANLGLEIYITEFDVSDRHVPFAPRERDRIVADYAAHYLRAALSNPAVKMVVTWGLTDRYSVLNNSSKRRRLDGALSRGLPYNKKLKRKRLWYAMAETFAAAPSRPFGIVRS